MLALKLAYPLFGGVQHDVAVAVFLNSLLILIITSFRLSDHSFQWVNSRVENDQNIALFFKKKQQHPLPEAIDSLVSNYKFSFCVSIHFLQK